MVAVLVSIAGGNSVSQSRLIRDQRGSVVGKIVEDAHGSSAYDARGQLVGRYHRKNDQTYDGKGRVVSTSGDALSSLIFDSKR